MALLGLLGVSFGAFAMGGPPPVETPVAAAGAVGEGAETTTAPEAPAEEPKKTTPAEEPKEETEREPARTPLERALADDRVVVVLFYAPDSAYDTIQTREARAGAQAAGAGFLAVDVSDEDEAAALATEYEVRTAPATLVFVGGPRVAIRIRGYADRDTVEQAAVNARR